MTIAEVKERMCDNYCYFRITGTEQESLDQICETCPLDNYKPDDEYPLGRNDWQE